MGAHVALTVGCLRKCSRTLGALEGLLPAVRPHVVFHVGHVVRGVQALAADQRIFPCESFFLVPLHPHWGAHAGMPEHLMELAWPRPFGPLLVVGIFLHCPPLEKRAAFTS